MKTLYFAYGSNLNLDDLYARADLASCDYKPVAPAQLYDYRLNFNYRSISRGGGALNLTASRGCTVDGYLFEVDDCAEAQLDAKEGVSGGYYERVEVTVFTKGGRVRAFTYVACAHRERAFCPPAPEYVAVVEAGLKRFGLSTANLHAAAKNQVAGQVTGLFVYGTLMRQQPLQAHLPAERLRCCILASTQGVLYDLGSYPGMLPGEGEVQGEFLQLRGVRRALEVLDRVEGFAGYGCSHNLYERRLVTCDVGDRLRTGWAYFYCGEPRPEQRIASGDWRQHCGVSETFMQQLATAHANGDERRVAAELANRVPYAMSGDVEGTMERILPLARALRTGFVSERRLAQESELWTALC